MFEIRTVETRLNQDSRFTYNNDYLMARQALGLFQQVLRKGVITRWLARITKRANNLLSLDDVQANLTVRGRYYGGIQAVLVERIVGSEGRSNDFDASFNPLNEKTSSRWLSIANARLQGVAMPAVELIQIGDFYFVRDGHHRISVAKAFGEEAMDAQVTVWDVCEPLACGNVFSPVYNRL